MEQKIDRLTEMTAELTRRLLKGGEESGPVPEDTEGEQAEGTGDKSDTDSWDFEWSDSDDDDDDDKDDKDDDDIDDDKDDDEGDKEDADDDKEDVDENKDDEEGGDAADEDWTATADNPNIASVYIVKSRGIAAVYIALASQQCLLHSWLLSS